MYSEREKKIILVSLLEETTGGGRRKGNVRELNILKQPIYV
jgi:hypothetical protein